MNFLINQNHWQIFSMVSSHYKKCFIFSLLSSFIQNTKSLKKFINSAIFAHFLLDSLGWHYAQKFAPIFEKDINWSQFLIFFDFLRHFKCECDFRTIEKFEGFFPLHFDVKFFAQSFSPFSIIAFFLCEIHFSSIFRSW